MTNKSMNMSWVVVKDLDAAIKFYTEVLGLKLRMKSEHYPWAELGSPNDEGAVLGVAGEEPESPAGRNAIVCINVEDIERETASLKEKGTKLIGEVIEVPGHVKLQMFQDQDGNRFQLAERL